MLRGGRGVADQDMSSLAQPEAVPAEVVEEDPAQCQEPDAEGDHRRPEEERDERHEECRVERRQDDDGEPAQGGAQAEDLEVDVAQGAGKPFIPGVLSAEADPLVGRPQHEGAHREGAKNDVDQEEGADGPTVGDEGQLDPRLIDGRRGCEEAGNRHRAVSPLRGRAGRGDPLGPRRPRGSRNRRAASPRPAGWAGRRARPRAIRAGN